MAADSGMGFHQGVTTSMYNHHMLSFQSSSDGGISGGGGGVTSGMVMAPRSVSGTSSNAGLYLSPNTGVISNSSGVGPSRSSSGDVFHGSGTGTPKYKFVTGSPSDWSDQELNILKEGLVRYAREPNIMRYIKIAAMLPKRTIRDVALRCWWSTGKDKRKKPDGSYSGKKMRDMKEKMVTSSPVANFHVAHANNVTPFSISMQQPNQQCQVPKEGAPVIDNTTQHLLEENNQLINQIAANMETFKVEDNTDLFLRTSSNIKTILSRMSETPGIMAQMPSLPVSVNENHLNSLLQLQRMVASYGPTRTSHHTKQEPRS